MGGGVTVGNTLGATLVGAFLSAALSGILTMQVIIYYRLYSHDFTRNKIMVGTLWVLDTIHVSMVCAASWSYLVTNRGDDHISDYIPWTIAVTVALTAFITFIVHCFFVQRIYCLGGRNLIVTLPLFSMALSRLIAALISTAEMIRFGTYPLFISHFAWVFTIGLSLSAVVDVFITVTMLVILRKSRTGYSTITDHIIDSIALYTIETGLVTCITTVVSLVCWISMPHNLVFLALHFTISKLYSNSVLATLNARRALRRRTRYSSSYQPTLPTIIMPNPEDREPVFIQMRIPSIPSKPPQSKQKAMAEVYSTSDLARLKSKPYYGDAPIHIGRHSIA